jgi:hypothetical protein
MLGNDQYGDCVAVMSANYRRLVSAALGIEAYPTLAEVLALYKTQNPNFPAQDDGMDMQTLLEYWHSHAWGGTQLVAFAAVDPHNLAQVKAAIAIFGAVLVGMEVRQGNVTEFGRGQTWGYVPSSPVVGGHAVLAGGYLGKARGDVTFITWGAETKFTDLFVEHAWQEAYVAIMPEHFGAKQFLQGVDVSKLVEAYQQLTGQALPLPPPVQGQWSIQITAPSGDTFTVKPT